MQRVAYRTCNICEATCGLRFDIEGDGEGERVVRVTGDADDPFSQGYVCPKGPAMKDVHEDPDRLRRPLVRGADGELHEASWDEAFERAASGLARVVGRHGRHALGHYIGNPTVHNIGGLIGSELFRTLHTSRNRYTANSQDANPHLLANLLMHGAQLLHAVPDIERTDLLVIVGANPLASNGSLLTAPGIGRRLKAIKSRGGRIVVIDPRRTETAALASEHLRIRPGEDALLLLALARTMLEEGLCDERSLAERARGLDRLPALLEPFAPDRVAPRLGPDLDASVIRRLARDLARTPRAALYGRVGVCLGPFAGLAGWALNLVNTLAGNVDREGGLLFPEGPAGHLFTLPYGRGSYDRYRSPQGAPEVSGELPCRVLADQIERGREHPDDPFALRALVVIAGNPVLSAPNGSRLREAFRRLDCLVAIDIYPSETARLATVVLPPRSALEEPHMDLVFAQLSVENAVRWSEPVFPAQGDQPGEFDILKRLALDTFDRLPKERRRLKKKVAAAVVRRLGVERVLDLAIRTGPLGDGFNPFSNGLTLARIKEHPHGLPTRPLEAGRLARLLCTPDRKIDLAPTPYAEDLPRLAARLDEEAAPADAGLLLIGRRHLKSNNSWLHNVPGLRSRSNACTLLVHPDDAAARGLQPGGRARVRSRTAEREAVVEVTDAMLPGVVSLPHGWGHEAHGGASARARPGVSVNDLTDDRLYDPLTGNAGLNGVPVQVEALPVEPVPVEARTAAPSRSAEGAGV